MPAPWASTRQGVGGKKNYPFLAKAAETKALTLALAGAFIAVATDQAHKQLSVHDA